MGNEGRSDNTQATPDTRPMPQSWISLNAMVAMSLFKAAFSSEKSVESGKILSEMLRKASSLAQQKTSPDARKAQAVVGVCSIWTVSGRISAPGNGSPSSCPDTANGVRSTVTLTTTARRIRNDLLLTI